MEKISTLVKRINTHVSSTRTRDTKKTRERERERERERKKKTECVSSVDCVSFFQKLLNREDEKEEEEETRISKMNSQQQQRGMEEKKTFEIPLASVVFFASSGVGVGSKTNNSVRSNDSYESILQSLRAVADASDEIFGNVEKEIDRLVSKALEMDGRVRRCERKIAEAQRKYYDRNNNNNNNNNSGNVGGEGGEEDLLVLESSRKYVVVADDEEDGAKQRTTTRRMMYYDDDVRNAIQRANENRPKRRAFKDVENMAMRARRYGESARALARSLMKGDGRSALGESEADRERLDREDNASSRKLGGNRAHVRLMNRKGSLADVMPAKTAFYDCEALRFGRKAKDGDGENEEEEEVSRDGNEKVEDLSDGFAKKLLLSSPPPKSIVPPEIVRSVRMPDAEVNTNTSTSGENDDGGDANVMSAKKSLESVFSFRPKASEAPVVVFPGTLPSPIPSASKSATGEQRKEGFGGSDVYEFTLTSENPYSPSAFLRNPHKKKAPSSRKKKSSTPTSQKSSVRSSNNGTIAINRQAPSSSPFPPPPASNNSREEVPSPAADDGGRGALMEAIRRGAKLRKVSVSTERDAPRASNASGVDDTTDYSAAEGDKAKTANALRGGSAQMIMMEELANQLRRRRSTVVSSQKKQ